MSLDRRSQLLLGGHPSEGSASAGPGVVREASLLQAQAAAWPCGFAMFHPDLWLKLASNPLSSC